MRLIAACLLVLVSPAAAAAQAPQPGPAAAFIGRTVTGVHLVSEGRPLDDAGLLDLIETRVGRPLSMTDVRESISHLFSLGRFEDILVDASSSPGGVALRYNLVPVHRVSRVELRGNLGVSQGTVRRMIDDRFGPTPPAGRAADVASVLERQFYPDHGYMRARVTAEPVVTHDPERTVLTFRIDAGPHAVIRDVVIAGDLTEGRAPFQQRVHAAKGDPYDPTRIRNGLNEYVQKLKKNGRYEAAATFVPKVSDDGAGVDLRFDVQPGPVVSVVFRGDSLPPETVKELVPIEREGSIDRDLLEDSTRRITDYLNAQGYWKATATVDRDEESGTVVFTVHKGLLYRVAPGGVQIEGNRQLTLDQLRPRLERLQADAIFTAANLTAAVAGIASDYARRGFAWVKVDSAANELNPTAAGLGQVKPVIAIEEGPLTYIGDIAFEGNDHLSREKLRQVVTLSSHEPYYEPDVAVSRDAVQLAYLNAGFASANVVVKPVVSEDRTRADLHFQITEGPQTIVNHVIIVGNVRTDPQIIRRELQLKPGSPLGLEDKLESRRRLGALGLFRRISIEELPPGADGRRDVVVTVEEAAATTLGYGGGLEITRRLTSTAPDQKAQQQFDFGPRGFFDVGRRNIAGKNRSVNLFTRLALRPKNGTSTSSTNTGGFGFVEYPRRGRLP